MIRKLHINFKKKLLRDRNRLSQTRARRRERLKSSEEAVKVSFRFAVCAHRHQGIQLSTPTSRPQAVAEMGTRVLTPETLDIAFVLPLNRVQGCHGDLKGLPWWPEGRVSSSILGACFLPVPLVPMSSSCPFLPSQDFTSSQSWSVESSTSDSPTSRAIINEMSESLLTAGSWSLLVVKMASPS